MKLTYILAIFIIIVSGFFIWRNNNQFDIPEGKTTVLTNETAEEEEGETIIMDNPDTTNTVEGTTTQAPQRSEVFVTDGVKHSIPLDEILGGGPPKDGIPSIDEPVFIAPSEADFLTDSDVGLGLVLDGVAKFYPYQILVWHEIVNDGDALVTYCPLCATGVVFDPHVNGTHYEFGVSGKLWQSNLLMYNRTGDENTESLWSQVLGEAVLGPETGVRLDIISSDTVLYGDWVEKHPDTLVLSRDTGAARTYGLDPYGDYYTNNDAIFFPVANEDDRLEAKAFVLGIEVDGEYKAYETGSIPEGTTTDTFAGQTITLEKDDIGGVRMFIGDAKEPLPYIGGFWFSWVAVHPETEVFN